MIIPEQQAQAIRAKTSREGLQRPKVLALRRVSRIVAVLAIVGVGLGGCGSLETSSSNQVVEAGPMNDQFMARSLRGNNLVSTMSPISLRLRRGWRPAPDNTLHNSADLQAYNPAQNIFLIILGEKKAAIGPGNLEEQATVYLQLLKGGFDQVISDQARTGVDKVEGFPAVQYEVRGEVLGKTVAYLHTTVEMGDSYYQVVVWTPADLFPANADEMRAIVQELREDKS